MSLPTQPPTGGGERAYVHFHYCNTEPGAKWHAYIAGACMWFWCHPSRRTKPCLHIITEGKLECPKCGSAVAPQLIGYQPLYREIDSRPVFIVLHEYTRETVDKLALHTRVIVGREASQSDGVWLMKALSPNPVFSSTLRERQRGADLSETLLRVWGIPALTTWYRGWNDTARTISAPEELSMAPTNEGRWRLSVPPPTTSAEALAIDAHRVDDTPLAADLSAALERVKGREAVTSNAKRKKGTTN